MVPPEEIPDGSTWNSGDLGHETDQGLNAWMDGGQIDQYSLQYKSFPLQLAAASIAQLIPVSQTQLFETMMD